ncbi:IS630 family transposase [Wolbachia endosymbiont of Frankliniella intonsa]|uniref:IS630 family transposase n=1 Tax=Wolbachia endosymbiont of Frankliniella intonsa TaxID=2902422 RepID=UPI00244EFA4D|nr:IS630 family transposase [Wolbachia endosymbiont of Frankliniella intonsa]WGJ62168.1 IS630 family transposase [Wolbachia endosymbiont of Frankliniella intonsa]
MPAAYSYDLRKKAMEVLDEGKGRETVAERFKIGRTTLWEWQQRKKETGDFQSKKLGNGGYNHKITDWNKFTEFAKKHGGKTLSEMAKLWSNVSIPTIHLALKKLDSHAKKTYGYKERNEEKRAEFLKIIATKEPQNLVYIDESGIDNTEDYPYGYSQKGQRFYALKSGKKTQRISMIAALNSRKIVVPLTFEGHCNMDIFNKWFEQFLTPILEPGQTVILDNATFHKSNKITELAKEVGAEILYLPTYSPDFNKIEHHWFAIKNRARKNIPLFTSFRHAVDSAFL